MKTIARKHNKSIAQVVLRWLIQRDVVVIPKSVHKERIIENIQVFDFDLTQDEMKLIATLDTKSSIFIDHRSPEMVKWLSELKF